jgi:cobalt-zinc-cadmium resistance protein CzcA
LLVDIPANLLSLGAMDFGIIVDRAVIVVEYCLSFVAFEGVMSPRFVTIHRDAVVEVSRPRYFGDHHHRSPPSHFTLQRHEGHYFSPMAWTVTSALIPVRCGVVANPGSADDVFVF